MSRVNECPSIGPADQKLSAAMIWVSRSLRNHLSRFATALDTETLHDLRAVLDWQQNTPILSLAIPPLEHLLGVMGRPHDSGSGAAFQIYSCRVIRALKREIEAIQEQLSAGIPQFTQAARRLKVNTVDVLSEFETAILAADDQTAEQRRQTGKQDAYELNQSLDYPTCDVILAMFEYGSSEAETRCQALRQALENKSDKVQLLAESVCMTDRFRFLSFSNLDYYQKTVYPKLDATAALESTRHSNQKIVRLLADAGSDFVASANERRTLLADYS